MKSNLRHLRIFLAVADTGSITRAAESCHVSQPAVTQVIGKLERLARQPLFLRRPQGLFLTPAGDVLARRVRRTFSQLHPPLDSLSARLRIIVTSSQLQALIAMCEAENFTLAAKRMGLAQPTVHRAVSQLEQAAGRSLFERTPHGMIATRPALALAQGARLAFTELEQAEAELAALLGQEVGRIVIGAMPLSRSSLLPQAIARFRERYPALPIRTVEGPYEDLLNNLRRGELDLLIGALRDPAPIADVEQQHLLDDPLVMVARPGHRLARAKTLTLTELARYPFVVAPPGTPTRQAFDRLFAGAGVQPASLVETGSMILMRELLRVTEHIGCISATQVTGEVNLGALCVLPIPLPHTRRPIGLTVRRDWIPTAVQRDFLDQLRAAATAQVYLA
jgi:DNA-binding transcriptional LysR family regulator